MHQASEEYTCQKQLPLRHQKDKPVLKYNSSTPASNQPVHLFNHIDVVCQRKFQNQPLQSSVSSSACLKHAYSVFNENTPQNEVSYNIASSQINFGRGLPNKITTSSTKNPYVRPLSAKDLEPANGPKVSTLKKNASASSLISATSSNSGSNGKFHSKTVSPVVNHDNFMQTNTFMRPRSAYKTETTKMSTQGFVDDLANTLKLGANCEKNCFTTVVEKAKPELKVEMQEENSSESLKRDPHSSPFEFGDLAPPHKTTTVSSKDSHMSNETRAKTGKSTFADSACSGSVSTVHMKSISAKPPLNLAQSVHNPRCLPANRPIKVTSEPGFIMEISNIKHATVHSLGNVRNPNYTPNKPYSEVNSGLIKSPLQKTLSTEAARTNHSDRFSDPNLTVQTLSVLPIPPSEPTAKKMPVKNSLTGNINDKKSFKAEEMLHDLDERPRAENSAHSASRIDEMASETNEEQSQLVGTVKKERKDIITTTETERYVAMTADCQISDSEEWESEDEERGDTEADVMTINKKTKQSIRPVTKRYL